LRDRQRRMTGRDGKDNGKDDNSIVQHDELPLTLQIGHFLGLMSLAISLVIEGSAMRRSSVSLGMRCAKLHGPREF
jgi:hypothetical protein